MHVYTRFKGIIKRREVYLQPKSQLSAKAEYKCTLYTLLANLEYGGSSIQIYSEGVKSSFWLNIPFHTSIMNVLF